MKEKTHTILNGYKFIQLDNLPSLQKWLIKACLQLEIKGTILLALEGINIALTGSKNAIVEIQKIIDSNQYFKGISYLVTQSDTKAFSKLCVRIKPEIVALKNTGINPSVQFAPRISPDDLHRWYEEKKDFVLLDIRNDYEVEYGTFKDAKKLPLDTFRNLPKMMKKHVDELKDKTVVSVCTGGIRCEKASIALNQMGIKDIHQLDGGILNYLKQHKDDFFEGDCFVFDDRIALDTNLETVQTN